MIQLRLTVADLGQLRFAYSPLAEAAESLYMLSARRLPDIHRGWFDDVRHRLGDIDMDLLLTAVPARSYMADFLFGGATSPQTSIERQLAAVAAVSPDHLRREFATVWTGGTKPAVIQDLVADPGGARRLANELWKYWTVALEPHWRAMRAVFDDDVTYSAAELTRGGATAMVADLHPEIKHPRGKPTRRQPTPRGPAAQWTRQLLARRPQRHVPAHTTRNQRRRSRRYDDRANRQRLRHQLTAGGHGVRRKVRNVCRKVEGC